jgi:murein DD-endopeptidase MepM/ murein hydrolase activator NlpD
MLLVAYSLTVPRGGRYDDAVARSGWKLWLTLILVPSVIVVAVISYLAWRQSVPGVRAELSPIPRFLGARATLSLRLRAARGGVRNVELRLKQGQAQVVLAQQSFQAAAAEERLQVTMEAAKLGLREGAATLEVLARDGYWRPLRVDDQPAATVQVTLDFTPPTLEVVSATRYLSQGGGGVVVARAKGATRLGASVGGVVFPSFPTAEADSGLRVIMIALPWDFPGSSSVTVLAEDEARNSVTRTVPAEIKGRRFPAGTVDLSDEFLARKLPELLPERGAIPPDQAVSAFLTVNRDKRREAEAIKGQLAAKTQLRPLWEGAFLQPRNTKVFSNFAEKRSYRYQGREIDTQVHLGYDLASVKQSPVPAGNAGTVVFAGPLTIYGTTVVVDHGLGLQTLYAHLSSMAVKEGDEVKKGQELGRTGATGLAVGDHLHYEVLINGVSVTPLEWWDAKWIRDRIVRPLREANVPLLQSEAGARPR